MYIFNAKYERKNKRAITKRYSISNYYTLAEAWNMALNYFIRSTEDDEILVDIRWIRLVVK